MKYIDEFTPEEQIKAESSNIAELLDAMRRNRRRTQANDNDAPLVTEAIRYSEEQQDRMVDEKLRPELSPNSRNSELADLIGNPPLHYQVSAWDTIYEADAERTPTETSGVLVSAPTGFGKTEAFMAPLIRKLSDNEMTNVIFVYPRRALLANQLGRVMKYVHKINNDRGSNNKVSIGTWYSDVPFFSDDILKESDIVDQRSNRFKPTRCWCEDENGENNPFQVRRDVGGYKLVCEGEESHTFDPNEFIFDRKDMRYENQEIPNILLTTLESLENISIKPHYDIFDLTDAIVFDEIHLFNGIYGSHAANVIRNLKWIKETEGQSQPLLIGSSATLDSPDQFTSKIFDLPSDRVHTVEPSHEDDFDTNTEDSEYYYFLKAGESVRVASTFIQQMMLFAHANLQSEGDTAKTRKILAFINSISQINQRAVQFADADRNDRLWEHHQDGEEDWQSLADELGRKYIDRPINVEKAYADANFDQNKVTDAELILATEFLEVGIDIGEIDAVAQYRSPDKISSFKQRAGRAGRNSGDSHVLTFLTDQESDSNLFRRAERFLDREILTPLRAENETIEQIHGLYRAFYEISTSLGETQQAYRVEFLNRFISDELEYPSFYRFLNSPGEHVDELLENPPANVLGEKTVETLASRLQSGKREIQQQVEPVAGEFETNAESLLRSGDATVRFRQQLSADASEIASSFDTALSAVEKSAVEQGQENRVEKVKNDLETVKESIEAVSTQESTASHPATMKSESDEDTSLEAVLTDLRSILWDLRDIETDIGRLQDMVDTGDTSARSKGSDNLDELRKTIDTTANAPDNLEELHVLWSQYYFLEQCLGYLGDYYGNLGNSYQSLPAVKDLLRAAYSFSKFEQAQQTNSTQKAREEPIQLPYVPENYFGSTGQTMFVDGEWKGSVRTEGVEELFRKYTPYRTQYASDGTVLDIFQPPTTKLSDNSIRFDTTGFDGTERGDLLVPDRIKLKRVRDVSGNDGDAIIRYCPECLEILDDQVSDCPEHGKGVTGTIYSEPQIATEVREFTQSQDEANSDEARTADQGVDIRCGNLKANLWLDLVELNVREYIRIGDGSYIHRNGEDAERKVTAEPDSRLGYTIETRGIKWSIEEIAGELVDDELTDLLDQRGSLTELQPTRLVYHTAAHFLQQVVADVSGVNSSMLKYDYDIESGTVHVFEETEGGQGIADLFIDTLESDTSRVLQAASHVGYDIRLVNERVWSDPDVLGRIRRLLSVQDESVNSADELNKLLSDKLAVGGTTEADDHIEDVIRNAHVPNGVKPDQLSDSLHADVIQEFKSTLGRVNEVSSGNLSVSDTLTLKSEAAQHTLEGESMDDLLIQTAIKITETQEQMLELLWANNVDGGLETLQLRQCLAHNRSEQADTLSQEVAQRLWVELTNLTSN